jgi:hypothetical protein
MARKLIGFDPETLRALELFGNSASPLFLGDGPPGRRSDKHRRSLGGTKGLNSKLTIPPTKGACVKLEEGQREVMSDPILFWTLFAVIAANIIMLVSAFLSVDREARRLPTDGEQT